MRRRRRHLSADDYERFAFKQVHGDRRARMVRHVSRCLWCFRGVKLEHELRAAVIGAVRGFSGERDILPWAGPVRRERKGASEDCVVELRCSFQALARDSGSAVPSYAAVAVIGGEEARGWGIGVKTVLPQHELKGWEIGISFRRKAQQVVPIR